MKPALPILMSVMLCAFSLSGCGKKSDSKSSSSKLSFKSSIQAPHGEQLFLADIVLGTEGEYRLVEATGYMEVSDGKQTAALQFTSKLSPRADLLNPSAITKFDAIDASQIPEGGMEMRVTLPLVIAAKDGKIERDFEGRAYVYGKKVTDETNSVEADSYYAKYSDLSKWMDYHSREPVGTYGFYRLGESDLEFQSSAEENTEEGRIKFAVRGVYKLVK